MVARSHILSASVYMYVFLLSWWLVLHTTTWKGLGMRENATGRAHTADKARVASPSIVRFAPALSLFGFGVYRPEERCTWCLHTSMYACMSVCLNMYIFYDAGAAQECEPRLFVHSYVCMSFVVFYHSDAIYKCGWLYSFSVHRAYYIWPICEWVMYAFKYASLQFNCHSSDIANAPPYMCVCLCV